MKAMILAAGLGSRLRPITDTKPKALVEVQGQPMLYWVIRRLKKYDVTDIVINLHHFPEQIRDYLKSNDYFGINISFSQEDVLLDTGGGLKQAARFFNEEEPFLLHNADVLTNLDYAAMLRAHKVSGALATLAARTRKTSRYLLFDQHQQLCGWESTSSPETKMIRTGVEPVRRWSFMGIHILSPRIFPLITEQGIFSIIDVYLRLAQDKQPITAFPADQYQWIDLGKAENIALSAELITQY
jgi:NDP-sugar pyrophosphorylase family protein